MPCLQLYEPSNGFAVIRTAAGTFCECITGRKSSSRNSFEMCFGGVPRDFRNVKYAPWFNKSWETSMSPAHFPPPSEHPRYDHATFFRKPSFPPPLSHRFSRLSADVNRAGRVLESGGKKSVAEKMRGGGAADINVD